MTREITKYTYPSFSNALVNDDDDDDDDEEEEDGHEYTLEVQRSDHVSYKKGYSKCALQSETLSGKMGFERFGCKERMLFDEEDFKPVARGVDVVSRTVNGSSVADWDSDGDDDVPSMVNNKCPKGMRNQSYRSPCSTTAAALSGEDCFQSNHPDKLINNGNKHINKSECETNVPQGNCNNKVKLNQNNYNDDFHRSNNYKDHVASTAATAGKSPTVENLPSTSLTTNEQHTGITPSVELQCTHDHCSLPTPCSSHDDYCYPFNDQIFPYSSSNGLIFAGSILLMEAISQRREDLVDYLISNHQQLSLDLNSRDKTGSNVLFYATSVGSVADVDKLTMAGCQAVCDYENRTVLMQAALSDRVDVATYLTASASHIGLDLHQVDLSGRNALFYA